jgi:hypothetical protein
MNLSELWLVVLHTHFDAWLVLSYITSSYQKAAYVSPTYAFRTYTSLTLQNHFVYIVPHEVYVYASSSVPCTYSLRFVRKNTCR